MAGRFSRDEAPAAAPPVARILTDDVDAAADLGAQLFFGHEVRPLHDWDRFEFELTAGGAGPLTVGMFRYGCEVHIAAGHPPTSYTIAVPLGGPAVLTHGGAELTPNPSMAGILRPEREVTVRGWPKGTENALLAMVERAALETELGRMLGHEIRGPIDFDLAFDISRGRGKQWRAIARPIIASLTTDFTLAANPMLTAQLSSMLMRSLLLSAGHPYRDALHAQSTAVRPAIIDRAATIIDDRAHEPLTVSSIAAEVGCSVRALQAGFRRHVGVAPHAYLERVRMDRAHAELSAGTPETTSVGAIAFAWGFNHLGRFAGTYRKYYGVSPSVTLEA